MSESNIWNRLNNLVPEPKCQTQDTGVIADDYKFAKATWNDSRSIPTLAQVRSASEAYTKSDEEIELEDLKDKAARRALTNDETKSFLQQLAQQLK